MSTLLLIELPGGNDTDVIDALIARGDQFIFVTADQHHYQKHASVWEKVARAMRVIESRHLFVEDVLQTLGQDRVLVDGVLCLVDIRLVEAAQLAYRLNLPFLDFQAAQKLRDKASVRHQLQQAGIVQPKFELACNTEALQLAVERIGLPCLIKPSDGYGSQNIVLIENEDDLEPWINPLPTMLPSNANYGLGVRANDRLVVEEFMAGQVIGCDTMTSHGQHQLLGVNEKLFFPPPSFAIEGGSFLPNKGQFADIERYVFSLLDTLNFNHGAAHVELKITPQGLRLIEVNARLVGAKIPRLMSLALGVNVYSLLIDLHLGHSVSTLDELYGVATSRWLTASRTGQLQSIRLPAQPATAVFHVEMLKQAGDEVRPPFENADRVGYVMTCARTRDEAEITAKQFIDNTELVLV